VALAQGLNVEKGQNLVVLKQLERGNLAYNAGQLFFLVRRSSPLNHIPLTILQKIHAAILLISYARKTSNCRVAFRPLSHISTTRSLRERTMRGSKQQMRGLSPSGHVTYYHLFIFCEKQNSSWSGTSYCRIHFLPFTRDGRDYAQNTPFINLWNITLLCLARECGRFLLHSFWMHSGRDPRLGSDSVVRNSVFWDNAEMVQ
jgi:hypothetical protein